MGAGTLATQRGLAAPALAAGDTERLKPYVPRLLVDWLRGTPDDTWREVEGTLAFVDVSGFTRLTERLARLGKAGAEEMSESLNATFAALLDVAYVNGAGLVKWGGDAVLLLFDGDDHAARACRAAYEMRATMRRVGRLSTSAGQVVLRISVGIHSGSFHFFLVGDPAYHRELLVSGPAASMTAVMEGAASAGEIAVSRQTAALLAPSCVGAARGDGRLLRSMPLVPQVGIPPSKDVTGLDLAGVLPVGIREHLVAQPGEAEHRTIAVGFVRFSGTDALLEREGPAALAHALDAVVANVQQACAAHAVTFFETDIDRDGGKIMLTAGAPVARGHDEDRMLRTARQVMERAGRLPLRIGVNRGPVFSGDFGPFFRRTYSVKGDAINLAARVTAKAADGEVLVTRAVLDRAVTRFEATPLAPFTVKGKSQPVDAAVLGPVRETPAEAPEAQLPQIVGRDAELATLEAVLTGVRAGQGRVVRLVGEPGIGKTRIVQELERRARLPVLATSCDEYEQTTPFLPARRLFRQALGVPPDAAADHVERRLRARVSAELPELLPWLPLLGIVLGVELPPTPQTRGLEEAFRKGRLEETAARLLAGLLPDPTLLVVDDVHFADESSRDLLRRVVGEVGAARPWLLVLTARDEHAAGLLDGPVAATEIRVRPLRPADARALADTVTEEAPLRPLPPPTVAALVERSGGNPLFLRGLLLAAASGEDVSALPETVEALVAAEIDQLPPAQRRMLRYAAVLGTTVDVDLLRQMLDDPDIPAGPAAFRPLRAFVRHAGGGRLRFRHAVIRDAAYDGLPFRRRRALHERAGALLLDRLPDPDAAPDQLAVHFFYAGRAPEAWRYCRQAGERARAQYAQAEAGRFLAWAAESGRRAAVPVGELVDVLEALGDVQFLQGLSDQAAGTYRQALRAAAGQPVRQAGLLFKQSRVLQRSGRLAQSLRRLTLGMHRVEGLTEPAAVALHSQLATLYGMARLQQGRYREARRWGELAVRLGEQAGDRLALAQAHNALEYVGIASGHLSEVPHGQIALRLYEELGELAGWGYSLGNLAIRALIEGRWDEGLNMYRQAADVFGRVGDEASIALAVYNQGDLLVRQGRVEEAEPLLRQAMRASRSVGDEVGAALALRELGKAAARDGRFEEGRSRLEEAVELLAGLEEPQEVTDARAALAECSLLDGQWADALQRCDGLLAAPATSPTLLPTIRRIRGFALLHLGDLAGARAELEAGLGQGASMYTGQERALLRAGLAEVAAVEGDPAARELLAESHRALRALGIVAPPIPA